MKKRDGLLIDAAISALLAYDARGQAIEEGALEKTAPPPSPEGISGSGHEYDGNAGRDAVDWNNIPL